MLNGIKEVAYELYKQDWIDTHTTRQMRLDDIRNWGECEIENDDEALTTPYEECVQNTGYCGGEIYVCFEEFLENEYQDKAYMIQLLDSDALVEAYNEDIAEE